MSLGRPLSSEYDAYYGLYIDQAPDGDILEILAAELTRTQQALVGLSAAAERFGYADDKWTVREVVGHLIDTEWTFAYRGLCFARADPAELPGFDQDAWARTSNAGRTPLPELLEAMACARRSSLAIFHGFDAATWLRRGIANGCEFTVRAMPYILAGHEIHHRRVLTERYLPQATRSTRPTAKPKKGV
ncbi:MAG: DinB family protein [Acidobacteriota bacterium]